MRDFIEFLQEQDPEMAEVAIQYIPWNQKDRAEKEARKKKPCGCTGNKTCEKCQPPKKQ